MRPAYLVAANLVTATLVTAVMTLCASGAAACGADTDCMLGERTYRVQVPDGVERPGAIVFAHGYRGSANGTMRNQNLRAMADRLGVALVAVKSFEDDWRIPGVPAAPSTDGQVELVYFDALIPALAERHGIDTGRMLFTGFSAGGMMVWQLACERGGMFAGFAPIAGTFWAPVPESCPSGPVHMFHTHGTADKIVPLEGRAIASTRQGRVPAALDMLRAKGYSGAEPFAADGLACERALHGQGHVLEFCTHGGGHSMKVAYIERVWDRLKELGAI